MARKKATTPKTPVKSTRKSSTATVTQAAATKTAPKSVKKAATTTTKKKTTTRTATKTPAKSSPSEAVVKSTPDVVATPIADAGAPLTGEALVKKVKDLGNLSKEEKAKACGYSAPTKNGAERVNMMKFYNALIDAEGIDLDGKNGASSGRGGRSASYRITVQSNGNLLIGAAYTKQMDLKPGDEFQITLGRKHIRLTQLDSSGNPEEE
jgi:hypothetical protein